MSTKKELLQKVKALADSGIAGEKKNAQDMLKRLMLKYSISEDDIEGDKRCIEYFRYSQEIEHRLLGQIIYMVTDLGDCKVTGTFQNVSTKY